MLVNFFSTLINKKVNHSYDVVSSSKIIVANIIKPALDLYQQNKIVFWQYIFFILFIFSPRIHFFQISGSTSDLRFDIITMILFGAIFVLLLFSNQRIVRFSHFSWCVFVILLYVSLIFVLLSNNTIYALFQIFWYATMLFSFYLSRNMLLNLSLNSALNFLRVFININVVMHLIDTLSWRVIGYERIFEATPVYGLAYGFFEIPSPFALVIGIFAIVVLTGGYRVSKIEKIMLIITMLFCESRIATGAFFVTMIVASSYRLWFIGGAIFLYVSLLFTDAYLKSLSFLTLTYSKLADDPSLLVRLGNMDKMIDWWESSNNFILGGGVLSHLEYSYQRGIPGPLDSFYLKMLSDFGLVSFMLFVAMFILIIVKNLHHIKLHFNVLTAPVLFVAIYSILNEGLVSIKSGHIVFFLFGILYWNIILRKRQGSHY